MISESIRQMHVLCNEQIAQLTVESMASYCHKTWYINTLDSLRKRDNDPLAWCGGAEAASTRMRDGPGFTSSTINSVGTEGKWHSPMTSPHAVEQGQWLFGNLVNVGGSYNLGLLLTPMRSSGTLPLGTFQTSRHRCLERAKFCCDCGEQVCVDMQAGDLSSLLLASCRCCGLGGSEGYAEDNRHVCTTA